MQFLLLPHKSYRKWNKLCLLVSNFLSWCFYITLSLYRLDFFTAGKKIKLYFFFANIVEIMCNKLYTKFLGFSYFSFYRKLAKKITEGWHCLMYTGKHIWKMASKKYLGNVESQTADFPRIFSSSFAHNILYSKIAIKRTQKLMPKIIVKIVPYKRYGNK